MTFIRTNNKTSRMPKFSHGSLLSEPIPVLVTRAPGQIIYSLLNSIIDASTVPFPSRKMSSKQIKKLPSKTWMWPFSWTLCQEGKAGEWREPGRRSLR
uniref:Uncharacterized protein n=1 Tax=Theropithecus gelada TaxID=9565 RepID=A0A8D2FKK5_THEGE